MDTIATRPPTDRADLFSQTSKAALVSPELVEKDFWVCWTLRQLFTISELSGHLIFKGGTSLSKVFNAISRFSEDIDLIVDYRVLGFTADKFDPKTLSKGRRKKIYADMVNRCSEWIESVLTGLLRTRFTEILGSSAPSSWTLATDRTSDGGAVIIFTYPSALPEGSAYIRRSILLEPGTHAAFDPHGSYPVSPIAALHYPKLFENPRVSVSTIEVERTFWEKATILHAECHRPSDKGGGCAPRVPCAPPSTRPSRTPGIHLLARTLPASPAAILAPPVGMPSRRVRRHRASRGTSVSVRPAPVLRARRTGSVSAGEYRQDTDLIPEL
jgi:hypothetical protein